MKHLILAVATIAALAGAVQAAPLSLAQISQYLNGLTTAKGKFTQISDDGSVATGTIYIRRPGRVRFEYDPPEESLVMAGGGQVAIFDKKSNQPPEQYPLKRTPLNLILARQVNLGRANMVVGHRSDGTKTTVVAQDPEHPDYGTIEMVFTGPPVELRQWVITGSDGSKTTVILGDLQKNAQLNAGLFNIPQEIRRRGN